MAERIYILAGGGTGGHLYPGLAVAQQLAALDGEAKIVFACSSRAIDRRILDGQPYAVVPQPILPAPHSLGGVVPFVRAWVQSVLQARQMVEDLRPAAVLGLGGFAAAPLVRQAAKAGIPTALLNPDAVPGKANRYLSRRCQAIFTQFASTRECFAPEVRPRVRLAGCPVRASFLTAGREEALRLFDLRPDRRTLLVNGGSQGAATINEAAAALTAEMDSLADTWQILHITGPQKDRSISAGYAGRKITVRCLEFCQRMEMAYAAADLALGRAGASTVAELDATATPALLLPYPYHKDRQQWLNAQPLADAGAGILVEDRIDLRANLESLRATLLPLLNEPPRLEKMKQAARQASRPQAAAEVAQWLVGTVDN